MSILTETVEPSPHGGLLARYRPPPGVYDEMLGGDGCPRPAWRHFTEQLEAVGPTGLAQRLEQARRVLRENGVRYNVHGAPQGPDRPWELDPVPLLFAKHEWDELAAGLQQRAWLLNAILADLYGPQDLLRKGLLPPELVFGNPRFLRPCHGLPVPKGIHLHLYACQLARGADGRWVVLADRTQGPSGAGYALENRIVTSRILPDEFVDLRVERLAAFFMTLRETLQLVAPRHTDNPRIVLLSDGPRSRTYFEDTYLARYLGYTLVEGGDLTIRGTGVYLKTLGGLLPVDVILRRVIDDQCDPLELTADSSHGVAGLVHATRCGETAIANALGTGLLENPALMAVLPDICQYLLHEPLKLASVPTWWCGREADRRYVEEHLEELAIRPVVDSRDEPSAFSQPLSRRDPEELHRTIRGRPSQCVGQAPVGRSTVPVWSNGQLQSWPLGLRMFAVAGADGRYQILPGGLARVAPQLEGLRELFAAGQCSKDVWILSDRPVARVSLLQPTAPALALRRSGNDLPSRVADNLFWLGRHLERAEDIVRLVRTIVVRLVSEREGTVLPDLALLVRVLCENGNALLAAPTDADATRLAIDREILTLLFDDSRQGTLAETLRALYDTASIVRDRISVDTWRLVNQLHLDVLFPGSKERLAPGDVILVLNQILNFLSALSGLGSESMTRGPGWRFLDMGRRLERALHVARLLGRALVPAASEPTPLLEALLEVADSSMTYRYRYLASLQTAPVLDLLLVDDTNPRSVGFQINALADHVANLPGKGADPLWNEESRTMVAAQAALRLANVDALAEPDPSGVRSRLEPFLAELVGYLRRLSEGITHTYFTHTEPPRRLDSVSPTGRSGEDRFQRPPP